jgi:hypothetical protein
VALFSLERFFNTLNNTEGGVCHAREENLCLACRILSRNQLNRLSTGSAEAKMIMGGRYLHSSYQGEMFGREFMGMGIAAYDQYKKKYVETWVDNHGTMVMMAEGTCGEQGNSRTVLAEFDDPMTHSPTWMRSVYRFRDPDHFTMEMFSKAPDGTEFKVMEIAHTRVK